jgi:hypothetical protein
MKLKNTLLIRFDNVSDVNTKTSFWGTLLKKKSFFFVNIVLIEINVLNYSIINHIIANINHEFIRQIF